MSANFSQKGSILLLYVIHNQTFRYERARSESLSPALAPLIYCLQLFHFEFSAATATRKVLIHTVVGVPLAELLAQGSLDIM
jgi:hypothetical protein